MNSLIKAELKSPVASSCGNIKIESQQKKDDYGQLQCSFFLESNLDESSFVFFTISKPSNEVGKVLPVFKSECKKKQNVLNLNQVVIDKDKIENNDPETDLVVHAFRYKENGQHEVVSTWNLTYQQLKECCEC